MLRGLRMQWHRLLACLVMIHSVSQANATPSLELHAPCYTASWTRALLCKYDSFSLGGVSRVDETPACSIVSPIATNMHYLP